MARNIKQLTNFDVIENDFVYKTVNTGPETIPNVKYYIITKEQLLGANYSTSEITIEIDKFGYCVNNNAGIYYPFFLQFDGEPENTYHLFYPGKTGMFEFQPEKWKNVNANVEDEQDEEAITRDAIIGIQRILVPECISFVIDYCFEV